MKGIFRRAGLALLVVMGGASALMPVQAAPTSFTVQVQDISGQAVNGFRWVLEEDRTHVVTPGVPTSDTLSIKFHTSHAPVISAGESTGNTAVIDGVDDTKQYFVSVLPFTGYSNGGAQVAFTPSKTPVVSVVVAQHPIPTAQISVFAYEDVSPISNLPDLPQELGLAGFSVTLIDTAGQYGIAGGQVSQDVFGNPLGTTYNPDGSVSVLGSGVILTDASGAAVIQNLAPGKYGIQVVPPAGQNWQQTHTIEGTKTVDTWVKANEPRYMTEFGPPGYHVFIGFVRPFDCFNSAAANPPGLCSGAPATGGSTISGTIVNLHNSRPPVFTFHSGHPFPACWVGLNDALLGNGKGVYAQPCNADSTFAINNVSPGKYQLVAWDTNLDMIFTGVDVTVPAGGGSVALGDVPVFSWYHRIENTVFFDGNQNGFRDCVTVTCNDPALDDVTVGADQATVNLRFRDGRVYQSMPTDVNGESPLEEVFPFFHWLVAEIDFVKLKATGVTVTVDAGGPVAPGEKLTPQPQFCTQGDVDSGFCAATQLGQPHINPNTGDNLSRTETGPVLLEAFQGFVGQTTLLEWGKSNYGPGENGGITGIVFYAVTRAEADPRYAVGEEWEPGIPRVQVNLYRDGDGNGAIDDVNGDGQIDLSDVDNYPLGWFDGSALKGPEDVDHNGNGSFNLGDALRVTYTDSWDDSLPSGCQGDTFTVGTVTTDCLDGLRNFNQVRPGVFDGGYAFGSANPADTPLDAGVYIVAAAIPPGYQLVKEEDKNVDFGDAYAPAPQLLPNLCVGASHTVPAYLSMQTDAAGVPYPGIAAADLIAAPYTGQSRPLCDRKQVRLSQGQNAAADFFLFTEVPKASHVVGIVLNNLSNEFNPDAPTFGEKFAPAWLPVAFRDWTGGEVVRTHADQWGKFNALLPSTYSVHIPMPSGVSPNMLSACVNDPGPVPNPAYHPVTNPTAPQTMVDPYFDRRFSSFCYTMQYMPGATTYLDTPVVSVAAYAGAGNPVDCAQPEGAPLVHSVSGPSGVGPYVEPGQVLTIVAAGDQLVANPAYDQVNDTRASIVRHYGFGNTPGSVAIGDVALINVNWSDGIITGTVPSGTATGQLQITRADGVGAPSAVTVTVGPLPAGVSVRYVAPSANPDATPIQDAIDLAGPHDLILVAPGTYNEMVLMYKPVRLQGAGAYSTVLDANQVTEVQLQRWRSKLNTLLAAGAYDLLPGQQVVSTINNQPVVLLNSEGAGITVLGKNSGPTQMRFRAALPARIDGFTVTGAVQGSGIFLNGYAKYVEISNNRVVGNQGAFAGGIRVGHADLVYQGANGPDYTNAMNVAPHIHHNDVSENGGISGPGGIALFTGAYGYNVNTNFICGNLSQGNGGGGGIGHLGWSSNGVIAGNRLLFNQAYNPGQGVSGGGIYVGGQAPLGGAGSVSAGTGHVTIDGNLIQGNQAGSGDGGGIRLDRINGADVKRRPNKPDSWFAVKVMNNTVVNNVAGLAGGGIGLRDALRTLILHNTVVHNDSTATAGDAFVAGNANQSVAQAAGVVARANSPELRAVIPPDVTFDQYRNFSNPWLLNNIIWQNRSFHWAVQGDPSAGSGTPGLVPDVGAGSGPVFNDLGVIGVVGKLSPRYCILTDVTGYHVSNQAIEPGFAGAYFNGGRAESILNPALPSSFQAQPAFDEGGNFIDVAFGPLTPTGDYHLVPLSPAVDAGNTAPIAGYVELGVDYDGDVRPAGTAVDIGADEVR